jgi:hypothetical protein
VTSGRDHDKRGGGEFPNHPYLNKTAAREAKEIKAKTTRDHQGKDVYPRGKVNPSHREDRRDRK